MRDMEGLKKEILSIGAMVEEAIAKAIHSLESRRRDLAEEVIAGDSEIDFKEVHVEDECLKILALHQPVAADLRYVVAILKVNNDLERMGDLAANIAKRSRDLAKGESIRSEVNLAALTEPVISMVRKSLDALIQSDVAIARQVMADDQIVDDLHKQNFKTIRRLIQEDPTLADAAIQSLSVSRALERVSDLATNIAEDVIFMVEGDIVRHGLDHQTTV